ncbi:hypothetical protein ACIBO4_01875 [Streptomyces sp. NPDC050149]|uniref:hypothetical protein n=1 Tax=Streptomyces sp. NPDC050149 TaxID=3365603 RepID=UPI0037A6531D
MDKRSIGPHAFYLIHEYDSRKPWEKDNFLTSTGLKAADIEMLRALQDSLEATRESAPETPRRRRPRSPRRPRVVGARPSNRSDILYAARNRRARRPVVLVIFVIGLK